MFSQEGRWFSDQCQEDLVHVLIRTLLNVIKNGVDEAAVLEASRCLGEIGPVDLSVLVLPNKPKKKEKMRGMNGSLQVIIEMLTDYLKSDDISLVTTSGETLRGLCQHKEVLDLIAEEMPKTRTDYILKPFKSAQGLSKPKCQERVFASLLETKLGMNELNEYVDYNKWITDLTCGLIECFRDENSLISLFLPICKIKVKVLQTGIQ